MEDATLAEDPMPEQEIPRKPRSAWVAALLTVFANGLGHVYAGRPWRGAVFWILSLLYPIGAGIALARGLTAGRWGAPWSVAIPMGGLVAVGVAYLVLVIGDAVRAVRTAPAAEPRWYNRWDVYATVLFATLVIVSAEVNWVRRNLVQS